MLRRNATIAGIMAVVLSTSLVNTKVTFATTTATGEVSSNKEETSSKDTNKALGTTWKADEGTKFDSEKKCTIKNIIFIDTSEGDNHTVSVIGNTINEEQVIALPNLVEIDGTTYNVTDIGKNAFYNCSGLTSIEIPDGITNIEEMAFYGSGVSNVKLPNTLKIIGENGFGSCTELKSIIIPNSVTSIEKSAFTGSGLISIDIPNSVTSIGRYAFYNSKLTSVVIPNSVTSINEGTFYGSNLTSITIPEGVTSIGEKAFYGCNGLTSITIPDSVTSIGEKACADSNITIIKASNETMSKLNIPDFNKVYFYDEDGTTILGAGYVKMYMTADGIIENPTKSGKVFKEWVNTDIGSKSKFDDVRSETKFKATYEEAKTTWDAEKKCTINNINFKDTSEGNNHTVSVIGNTINEEQAVALPNSVEVGGTIYNVTSIGENAFSCCEKLTSITIPDGVKSIGKNALYNCSGLTSVEIPNGVTSIEEEVFQGCTGLINVTIPNSVTSIGKHSFDGCWKLGDITLPDGVTSIGQGAFYSSGLKSINIPNTVTNIEKYAFYNSGLTSVVIPNSVTSIEEGTFYRSGLTSITIPEGVMSIGAQAFYGCNELKSLTIPDSITSVGEKVCGDSNITVIKASKETMDKLDIPDFNKVYFYDEDNSTILGAGYVNMYRSATGLIENPTKPGKTFKAWVNTDTTSKSKFDDVRSETRFKATYEEAKSTWNSEKKCTINNITFKDTSEGDNNTVSVVSNTISEDTSVELPKSIKVDGKDYRVTSIGENAFYNLAKLKGITIPDGVTSIGKNAFYNCELSSLTIPKSVINIEEEAFNGCRDITELNLSKGLKNIGDSAFNFCSGLTELKIPDTVEIIGNSAFYGCSDLKDITIPDSVTSIGKYGFYGCRDLTSIEIPGSIKNIEEATFYDCSRLREVTLTNGLESIGKNAFYNSNGGDFVILPDSIQIVEKGAFTDSTLRRIKTSKETMDRLDIPDFNKVYFYDEDGTTMLGFGYVQQDMSAKCLVDEPTKTGKTFKGWVNTDPASKSTFNEIVNETNFKATYTEDIKGKIESILDELKVDNNTTVDDIINQVKENAGITVTISDFNKEEATENKEGYIEGNINAEESDGSAISVHFKNIIDKLSNNNDSELEDMIKETLDDMSVDNDTTEDDIVETVTQVTTGSAVKISVSDFKKKKATENKKGYIEGTVNAEEKDGNIVSVCFKKMIDKLSNESGNSELENLIRETLDKMSVNNDTTKGEILDTITEVTTGSAVKVKISDFNKEKATKVKAGSIEGIVNAEDEDGNIIDVYFKKIIAKLSNSDSSGGSSHHSKKKSSKKDNSSSNKETTIKEQTGNGKTAEPSNKELELGSMLKTINDNKVTLTNSWGDKNLSGTISNVVNKDGKYEGSIITASESGIAKLSIGHDEIKDLKYIYQYDSVTKLFIKVPVEITVDGNNIELPVKKDQTYYIAKSPVADNAVLKEGWNTVNGSTYRVEGSDLKTGWVLENNSWYYINDTSKARVENNWNLVNNKWYAFDEKGEMKTGWHYNSGNWYFLDTTTGDMKTGWKQQGDNWYNLESNGAMSTGWKKIDGSWYYFNSNGSMASNTVIDGYELGANGALTE